MAHPLACQSVSRKFSDEKKYCSHSCNSVQNLKRNAKLHFFFLFEIIFVAHTISPRQYPFYLHSNSKNNRNYSKNGCKEINNCYVRQENLHIQCASLERLMTRRVVNFFFPPIVPRLVLIVIFTLLFSVRSNFTLLRLVHRCGKNFVIYTSWVRNGSHHSVDKYWQVWPRFYDVTASSRRST